MPRPETARDSIATRCWVSPFTFGQLAAIALAFLGLYLDVNFEPRTNDFRLVNNCTIFIWYSVYYVFYLK